MAGPPAQLIPVENDPAQTSAFCCFER